MSQTSKPHYTTLSSGTIFLNILLKHKRDRAYQISTGWGCPKMNETTENACF